MSSLTGDSGKLKKARGIIEVSDIAPHGSLISDFNSVSQDLESLLLKVDDPENVEEILAFSENFRSLFERSQELEDDVSGWESERDQAVWELDDCSRRADEAEDALEALKDALGSRAEDLAQMLRDATKEPLFVHSTADQCIDFLIEGREAWKGVVSRYLERLLSSNDISDGEKESFRSLFLETSHKFPL